MKKFKIYIMLIKHIYKMKKYNKSNTKVIQFFEIFKNTLVFDVSENY